MFLNLEGVCLLLPLATPAETTTPGEANGIGATLHGATGRLANTTNSICTALQSFLQHTEDGSHLFLMKAVNFCGDSVKPTIHRIRLVFLMDVAVNGPHEPRIERLIHKLRTKVLVKQCRMSRNGIRVKLLDPSEITCIADCQKIAIQWQEAAIWNAHHRDLCRLEHG